MFPAGIIFQQFFQVDAKGKKSKKAASKISVQNIPVLSPKLSDMFSWRLKSG